MLLLAVRSILTSSLGIGAGLQSRLSPFITASGLDTDVQAKAIRVLNVPEYYAEYRDTGNGYAVFLGSSIVAKVRLLVNTLTPRVAHNILFLDYL